MTRTRDLSGAHQAEAYYFPHYFPKTHHYETHHRATRHHLHSTTQARARRNSAMVSSLIISPSILSADFAQLAPECAGIQAVGADWLHVDIMDGAFVKNLTIGAPVVASLRKHNTGFLDCHLMVQNPKQWIPDFAKAGADMYTFHIEAVVPDVAQLSASEPHPAVVDVAQAVRAAGMKVGLALKPATPAELALPYLQQGLLDLVLVLTVEPGFGGQAFKPEAAKKCTVLRAAHPALLIEVDGGITAKTAEVAVAAGANVLVAGSAIFGAPDRGQAITDIRAAAARATSSSAAVAEA